MVETKLSRASSETSIGGPTRSDSPKSPLSDTSDHFELSPEEHQYVQAYKGKLLDNMDGFGRSPLVHAFAEKRHALAATMHRAVMENPENAAEVAAQLHAHLQTLPAQEKGQFLETVQTVDSNLHNQVLDGYGVSPKAYQEYQQGSLEDRIRIAQAVVSAPDSNLFAQQFKKSLPRPVKYYRNGELHAPMDSVNHPHETPFIKTMLDGEPALTYLLARKVEQAEGQEGLTRLAQEMKTYWEQRGISDSTREQIGQIFRSIDNPFLQAEFDRLYGAKGVKVASRKRE